MARIFLTILSALVALAIWAAVVVFGTLEGWWRKSIAPRGDTAAFMSAVVAKIDAERRGNAAFVLIDRGQVHGEHFTSAGNPIDRDTLFQIASTSKWIAAWGVMKLAEAGKLDLDAPVSKYLTRWRLPPSEFNNDGVTVRRLLSHTAGLTDGLGYAGFKPGEPVQPLEESLAKAADASPGKDGAVRVGIEPGSAFKYSGGGYTLLQLLIEEVSGQSFNDYMKGAVLAPLGMERSTFVLGAEPANVAEFFDTDGSQATHFRFAALAAASLYTSVADMTRFIQAHGAGAEGAPAGRGVIKPETLKEMRRPHARQMGADIWGLGTILYAPNNAGDFIIGHDGNNEPAINTAVRLDPGTGNGIVVLETGNKLLATALAGEWVFWQTGHVDFLTVTMEARETMWIFGIGSAAILLIVIWIGWRWRRAKG